MAGSRRDGYDDGDDFRRAKRGHGRPSRRRTDFDAPDHAPAFPQATGRGGHDQVPRPPVRREAAPSGGTVRASATVQWFNPMKGFGFAQVAGHPDAFLPAAALEAVGRETVRPGAVLDCEIRMEGKGPSIVTIHSVDESAAPPPRVHAAPRPARPEPVVEVTLDGVVKFFDATKGFGFVATEQGDVFVHVSAVERSGIEAIHEGESYRVGIGQGQKGRVVVRLERGA